MKKNVLKHIENLKTEKKLSKEVKDKIIARSIANWAICISIAILIMAFILTANLIEKQIATFLYNVYAIIFMIFSIVIIEVAYKKDNGAWAVTGVEVLCLAIFTLFTPYTFFRMNNNTIYILIGVVTIYYICKIIRIVCKERKKYLQSINDIPNIIKKESQDEVAVEIQTERKEIMQKNLKNETEKLNSDNKKEKQPQTDDTVKSKPAKKKTTKSKTTTQKEEKKVKQKTTTKKATAEKEKTVKSKATTQKEKIEKTVEKEEKAIKPKTTTKNQKAVKPKATTKKIENTESSTKKEEVKKTKTTTKKASTAKPKEETKNMQEKSKNSDENEPKKKRGRPRKIVE